MPNSHERVRRSVPAALAVVLALALFFVARIPGSSGSELSTVAAPYKFTEMPLAMPPGYRQTQTIRQVNPAYYKIRSWISSVGAGVATADLTGHGRDDGICIVDPRTDDIVVTYAPTAPAADRFTPFALNPAPLPMDHRMAPMGCTPGDYNVDGRADLLVHFWGRTPILFLARSDAKALSPTAYQPVELVPGVSTTGRYTGPRWNTDALDVGSFDGTGHPDIFISNYFPDSDVLDPKGQPNVVMPSSFSDAKNGGGTHVYRWTGGTSGARPSAAYEEQTDAVPYKQATGWTLAISSADLTGDGKPEVYVANDFGKDRIFYNVSTPGHIKFKNVTGKRSAITPKSFAIGHDSNKGMGVDFGDLQGKGRFDLAVSNITAAWGLEESNFVFLNKAGSEAEMAREMADGHAPFEQRAQQLGLAWTGWCWDVKMGDFSNSGRMDVVQADGFIKGDIQRWPWLQEMAMNNDSVFSNPKLWPHVQPGDDLSGGEKLAFYAAKPDGKYSNVSEQLGLAVPIPTRGIAAADTRGTGALDLAVARQWGPPAFYANSSPKLGKALSLHLFRPVSGAKPGQGLSGAGTPAYGATVQIWTADGRTQISRLDGGGGGTGKRSFEVRFGLGSSQAPVKARVRWPDGTGSMRQQDLNLAPGAHSLLLTNTATEVPTS
ncbi:FG-GAP-like repeat-containing protein [Actinomadura litoris]|uniref:FG-GAP-like repeat-containing protein n=1 Tax=Actinomadura litoris TaxID=2678616 RepID=UPI001FA7249D|nr:FG-GAP-like repeat-containing protein [Actinomadura litoris]